MMSESYEYLFCNCVMENVFILGILVVLLFITGMILLVFWLPGNLVLFIGLSLLSLWSDFAVIPLSYVIVFLSLFLVGEALELVGGMLGARVFGASRSAAWGALFGGFVGLGIGALGFGVGVVPGLLLGMFLGALIAEHRKNKDIQKAVLAGTGSVIGWFFGVGVKMILAVCMAGIALWKIFKYI